MTVDEKKEKDKLVLYVKGRLDTTTAPQLEEIIAGKTTGLAELILDFTELEYISSAGLRVLLATHKVMLKQNGSLIIRGVN
ncbi:MAG: STAS domain-containing protein, partial [Lachnospiraceae bacterium]|nr:STAS domain-containing protein [Lachnospiraceae bacterium]